MESWRRPRARPSIGIALNVLAAPRWSMVCAKPLASAAKRGRHRCPTPFGSALAKAYDNCSVGTQTKANMENALTFIAMLVLWWVLQVWLLPRFGVPT
jgi:hypothetical protein